MRSDVRRPLRSALCVVAVVGLGACTDGFQDDFFADGPFDGVGFREVSAERRVALNLDSLYPTQRYQFAVTVDPPSPDARVTALFVRVDGVVVSELAGDDFANDSPSSWSLVGVGGVLTSFGTGEGPETYRLSAASNGAVDAAVEIDLGVTVPADVDFDGIEDDVVIDIGTPVPFFP